MATTVYLSNPALTINAVDLTDQATSATLTFAFDQLETTAFGQTARALVQAQLHRYKTTHLKLSYIKAMQQPKLKHPFMVWLAYKQTLKFHLPLQVWQRQALPHQNTRLQALIFQATHQFLQHSVSSALSR
jgi:hypothetical protein